MKQLVCEVCGSSDLIKQDGVFVCQACGCKYTLDEVRKMMVEGTVEVTGTVRVDNTAAIGNYLDMARNAQDAGNQAEADAYCNRIIEMDTNNWEAWFIKGKAVGWQSTLANVRIPESINAFSKALENCPEEKKEELGEECRSELERLQIALLELRMKGFQTHPNERDINGLTSDANTILHTTLNFFLKSGLVVNSPESKLKYARIINNRLCDAWKNVYRDYQGRENHPSDYELSRLIQEGDCLIQAFKLALALCGDSEDSTDALDELKIQILQNIIELQSTIKDSKSYEVSFDGGSKHYNVSKTLTSEAKAIRGSEITRLSADISRICGKMNERGRAERKKHWEEYWAAHPEEREQLTAELEQMHSELGALQKQNAAMYKEVDQKKRAIPERARLKDVESRIAALNQEKSDLGIFKQKEKRALQEQIDALEKEKRTLKSSVDQQEQALDRELSALSAKIHTLQTQADKTQSKLNGTWDDQGGRDDRPYARGRAHQD